MHKIVILDGHTTNPGDLSWETIQKLGQVEIYPSSGEKEGLERVADADILVTNKFKVTAEVIAKLPKLKLICQLATGYDNIDIEAAKKSGIVVSNAVGYTGTSVAQHVMSMILHFSNQISLHNKDVQNGGWEKNEFWSYSKSPIFELEGKTLGILGYGKIGSVLANMALSFGMKVIVNRRNKKKKPQNGVSYVSVDDLLAKSDFLSLNAPLTDATREIINQDAISKMKSSAVLINTGRGGLVNENDLLNALKNGKINGAALDVLSEEPPKNGNILIGAPNCIITPHHAWATKESRERLIKITADNIQAFLNGSPINIVG